MHGPEIGIKYRVRLTGLNLRGVLDRGPTSPFPIYRAGLAFRKISMANAPMNKAITSTGGTKPFLRENRHQSTHPAMVRMVVPAYRETVSMLFRPLRFGTGHLLAYNNTPRVRPYSKRSQLIAWYIRWSYRLPLIGRSASRNLRVCAATSCFSWSAVPRHTSTKVK